MEETKHQIKKMKTIIEDAALVLLDIERSISKTPGIAGSRGAKQLRRLLGKMKDAVISSERFI